MSDEFDLEALLSNTPQARDHHYVFAHIVLPQFAFALRRNTDFQGLAADLGFFRGLWAKVGETVGGELLSDAGLAAEYVRDQELDAVILTLPKAEVASEAIMAAIVRRPVRRWLLFRGEELRYFTLELGMRIEQVSHLDVDDSELCFEDVRFKPAGTRTVLCEWTRARQHSDYGDGPPAIVGPFAAAVFDLCSPAPS